MDLDTLIAGADPARHRGLDQADWVAADLLYRQITQPGLAGRLPDGRGVAGRRLAGSPGGWGVAGRRLAGSPGGWGVAGRRLAGSPGGRPAHRRAWPVVAGATAALAAAAVAASLLTRPAARPTAGRAPVAAVLDAAAVRAAHGAGAGQAPGPGQYLYVKEVVAKGLGSAQGCAVAPMTVQAWVAADGSGRQIGTFPAQCGKLDFSQIYQPGGLSWSLYGAVQASTLPTSPAALQQAIVQRFENGKSLPSATFVYAATFLNAGSPPALRAALYRVIEALPGVQNLGQVTDQLGRPGQCIGLVTAGARAELIFDPASTSVLEEETVAVAPPQAGNNQLPAGTVIQYTLYVQQGVVDSDSATPAPSGTPTPPTGTPTPAAVLPTASSASPTAAP